MAFKDWMIRPADKEKASAISEKFNIDPFIAFLLVSRGLDDFLSAGTFLGDSFVAASSFDFADMEEAAFAIGEALDMGDTICIYGDYDCDGVTATALLLSFLKQEGADAFYYIPSREGEGYGLNKEAIDAIHQKGAKLIVTVDNGISAVEEAEYIYSLGMKLVVTDHHQLGDTLPRAEAVVNPYREENQLEFRDYCGVGVAFKLICALYDGNPEDLIEAYIDLVAIGTIADVVPLLNENRAFVKAGLQKINTNPRPCIAAFRQAMAPTEPRKEFTAGEIAFQLCPRINAVGRMDDASKAVEYLMEENPEKCAYRFEQLQTENAHRQEVERDILADVERQISESPRLAANRIIVIAGKGYHHGVVGIVASHIAERYAKPAIIIGIDEEGVARGSARSIEGFNIFDAITSCEEHLIRYGGHPLAAGVTLQADKIETFKKAINAYALREYDEMPPLRLHLDCKISPDYLTLELVEHLKRLEPYGAMNPQPLFGVFGVRIAAITPLSEGKHIRLDLEKKGKVFRAVKFGTPYDSFPYQVGDTVNLAVKLNKNVYKERTYLSVQVVDIHLHQADYARYFAEKNEYERFRLTGEGRRALYPDREACTVIYRYLKNHNGFAYGFDELYLKLQNKVHYAQLIYALAAFSQAGLISIGEEIRLLPTENKVRLEDTHILKSIRERLRIG